MRQKQLAKSGGAEGGAVGGAEEGAVGGASK